jgi:hypothetical protein
MDFGFSSSSSSPLLLIILFSSGIFVMGVKEFLCEGCSSHPTVDLPQKLSVDDHAHAMLWIRQMDYGQQAEL